MTDFLNSDIHLVDYPGSRKGMSGVSAREKIWVGVDPGGVGAFGIAILIGARSCHTCTVDCVDDAVAIITDHVRRKPAGVGVDAPLWWSSGSKGLRLADMWIRDTYGLQSKNVQAVNSLWGAVLAQGMMFVSRIREAYPKVQVTEVHPKAVLRALDRPQWSGFFQALPTRVTLDTKPDHERDALIAAVAAREGFEKRWRLDLAKCRLPCEQDPSRHWLAPVHYFWPGQP